MKRIISITVMCVILLSLTSCTVNLFSETRDVPWWWVALPIFAVSVFSYYVIYSRTYVCPYCGFEFKPKWYELSALVHMCKARFMKCPACGKRGFCKVSRK